MRIERFDVPPFLVGIISIPAQAILLRELLARGAGNELSLTLYLALWLGGSALGACLWGLSHGEGAARFGQLVAAGVAVSVLALGAARFAPMPGTVAGEVPGPLAILLLGALVLLPSSFLTAGLFPIAARLAPTPGRAYVAEAIGAGTGGLLTTGLFLLRLTPLTILAVVASFVVAGAFRRPAGAVAALLLLTVAVLGGTERLDRALFENAWELSHPGLDLLTHAATPTRVLTLAEREGERWLFSDGTPREVLGDPYRDERITALILAAAPRVDRVLLVDFGAATIAPALVAAGVPRVVCLLPEREDTLLAAPSAGVEYRIADPRRTLKSMRGPFDVIALSGGEVVTVGGNRFWTVEAFGEMGAQLGREGVILAVTSGGEAAAGPEAVAWRRSVASALREAIGPVRAIDADDYVLAASKRRGVASLEADSLARRFLRGGRRLERYPPERFAVEFPADRLRSPAPATANRDLRPAAFSFALARWAQLAGLPGRFVTFLPLLVGGLFALFLLAPALLPRDAGRDGNLVLVATGAVSMGLDLLVLMAYQAKVGVLQIGLGVLLGAFLGGTAFGAALGSRAGWASERRFLRHVCLLQAALAGAAVLLLPHLPAGPAGLSTALFSLVAFALGTTCGLPFPCVARITSAARAWAADAAGGILGALLFLAFVSWGITSAGLVLAAVPVLVAVRLIGSGSGTIGARRPPSSGSGR